MCIFQSIVKYTVLKSKLLFFFLLICSPIFTNAQNDGGLLIVGVYESLDPGYAKIIVTENGKVLEELDLGRVYYKKLGEQQAMINEVLDRYEKGPYTLVNASGGSLTGGSDREMMITTYLFRKE